MIPQLIIVSNTPIITAVTIKKTNEPMIEKMIIKIIEEAHLMKAIMKPRKENTIQIFIQGESQR